MVAQALLRQDDRDVVRYWPRGASADLFKHHEPIVIVSGPAGTGKTYGCLWRLHLAALKYPGMRGIMLRKVQEDLTASALVTYQERVLGSGRFGVRPFGGSKLKPAGFQYPNGSELLIGGLDKADKVMSREYDLIYTNECWELSEDDLEKLSTRARWGVMPYQQVFGDTNPQGPGHHLYKAYVANRLTMLFSFHKDNPVLWNADADDWTDLGRDYLARLGNLSGHRRQRLLDGVWVAAEGVVYPNFNRQTHVKTVDCTGWRTVLGCDIGSRNPTALLTIRLAGDERVHVEREVYRREMSSDDISDTIVAEIDRCKPEAVHLDPSAKAYIEALRRKGHRNILAANNEVVFGVGVVTAAFESGLTVDPACENTIEEFEHYRYPDGKRSTNDNPLKENDHCLVAGTMIETERGTKPIESIRPGERVWTRHGLRVVVASGMTNSSVRVYTLRTKYGKTITGSSLHPVWTENRGWVFLNELRYGDILCSWKGELRPSNSKALHFVDTPMRSGGPTERILSPIARIASAALVACMRRYGSRSTAPFRPVTRFITTMAMLSTTIPTTSFVSPKRSTGRTMRQSVALFTRTVSVGLKSIVQRRQSGTGRRKDGRGTVSRLSNHGPIADRLSGCAINAGAHLSRFLFAPTIGSVPMPVSRRGGGQVALMTSKRRALVVPSSKRTNTQGLRHAPECVLSVTGETERQAVYNLTVVGVPEFFANGILVHNSMDALRYGLVGAERKKPAPVVSPPALTSPSFVNH